VGSKDGPRRAADAHGRGLEQSRQRQHDRLQEEPGGLRGPALPERAPGGWRDLPGYTGTQRQVATEKTYTQGNLNQTGNALDLAISGRGFFQVLLPDGTLAYTRAGDFQMNNQGQLVTSSGYAVQPGINIPQGAQSITVGNDGVVSVLLAGASAPTQVGQVQLADFVNPAGLQPRGENLLVESASSGSAQTGNPGLSGLGTLNQGMVESSNVNVVEEMVNMIETQRAYEMNTKAIQTTDQMLQYLSSNV
jgi:flagellar basal-body rod protein FlgG